MWRGMSHRSVETLLGRLATDPTLRRRFARNAGSLLEELRSQGLELTGVELEALASTEAHAIDCFAQSLDERLRKADFTVNPATSLEEPVMSPTLENTTVPIHGIFADQFEKVRQAFIRNFAENGDVGASAAVYIDGEPVVDLWGGYADKERTRPWERD